MIIEWDLGGIPEALDALASDTEDGFERAGDLAGAKIVRLFRDEQLSGRWGDDYGLNRVTGNLWESLRNVTVTEGEKFIVEVFNRGAKYWWYHQMGLGVRKRLYFEEHFAEFGVPYLETEVESILSGLAA